MNPLHPSSAQFWIPIGVALVCGGIVGLERQLRGKPAGVRTTMLICIGTQLFVRLGTSFVNGGGDPARIIGQVVTGIGFLGAGVIMSREGAIVGVTTAAVIWVVAAIGAMVGLGYFSASIVIALLVVAILTGVELVESAAQRFSLRRR